MRVAAAAPVKMLKTLHCYKYHRHLTPVRLGPCGAKGHPPPCSFRLKLPRLQHGPRQFHRLFVLAAKHTGDLLASGFTRHLAELGERATASDFFRDNELRRCRRRHRGQMRDAKHLMPLCQFTHSCANSVSNFATDVSVDLVEYE